MNSKSLQRIICIRSTERRELLRVSREVPGQAGWKFFGPHSAHIPFIRTESHMPSSHCKESGKCSLLVCLGGQGRRFADHGALSLPLASRITKEKNRDWFSSSKSYVFSIAPKLRDSSCWMTFDPNHKDRQRGTHTTWGQKRDWKVIQIFFLMVYFLLWTHIYIFDWIFQISCTSISYIIECLRIIWQDCVYNARYNPRKIFIPLSFSHL